MNPSLDYLRDPFLMKDMQKAVDRIKLAVEKNEKKFGFTEIMMLMVYHLHPSCVYILRV